MRDRALAAVEHALAAVEHAGERCWKRAADAAGAAQN
jgi:hypothetical protein